MWTIQFRISIIVATIATNGVFVEATSESHISCVPDGGENCIEACKQTLTNLTLCNLKASIHSNQELTYKCSEDSTGTRNVKVTSTKDTAFSQLWVFFKNGTITAGIQARLNNTCNYNDYYFPSLPTLCASAGPPANTVTVTPHGSEIVDQGNEATIASSTILSLVIVAEGVVVIVLAIALYRVKRTLRTFKTRQILADNGHVQCTREETVTRSQNENANGNLTNEDPPPVNEDTLRKMTQSSQRRYLILEHRALRRSLSQNDPVQRYSQRVLPTPYEEIPQYTFGSPLSATNPLAMIGIDENPYQELSSEDVDQGTCQPVSGNTVHTEEALQHREESTQDPTGDFQQLQSSTVEDIGKPTQEVLYQTVASIRDMEESPTPLQENFYHVLEPDDLMHQRSTPQHENPYHILEPDSPQHDHHYHVLEPDSSPQNNHYSMLEPDESPLQENPPAIDTDNIPQQDRPHSAPVDVISPQPDSPPQVQPTCTAEHMLSTSHPQDKQETASHTKCVAEMAQRESLSDSKSDTLPPTTGAVLEAAMDGTTPTADFSKVTQDVHYLTRQNDNDNSKKLSHDGDDTACTNVSISHPKQEETSIPSTSTLETKGATTVTSTTDSGIQSAQNGCHSSSNLIVSDTGNDRTIVTPVSPKDTK